MTPLVLTLTLAVLAADPPAEQPRSPIAPSLPALTREQEWRIDRAINRFILADTGQLRGEEARAAMLAFEALGLESVPQLIDGLNRAAMMEHSCPVLVLHRKLSRLLLASEDAELLEYAHDNIGAGVGRTKHARAIEDLRFQVQLRKNAVARLAAPAEDAPDNDDADLARAVSSEQGPKLPALLRELETRRGPEVYAALGAAAQGAYGSDLRPLARELLGRNLNRQAPAAVREQLKNDNAEVRRAAARAAADRTPPLGAELIDLLADEVAEVRAAAHDGLVRLNRGTDLGPGPDPSTSELAMAQARWREWWSRRP